MSSKRLFAVWNGGYKVCHVVADEIGEALSICQKTGHMRKATYYRKFEDQTDQVMNEPGIPELLAGNESGRAAPVDGVWQLTK